MDKEAQTPRAILYPGERFTYSGFEFVCLGILGGDYLAITAEPYSEIPFDVSGGNDWRKSSLRRVLNSDFLELLDKRHLVKQVSDLTSVSGETAYGTSKDYVSVLSYEQCFRYREILPHSDMWAWTLTPWNGSSRPLSRYARTYSRESDDIECTDCDAGVFPVCLFSSKALQVVGTKYLVEAEAPGGEGVKK